ncbi:hypothetical protein [Streptomyces sp. NPDC014746]|uniref:hypothetical protein n=1 Tax=Streptomyces sp. NPDC014746 TaxID=3364904 RepID=UPI0036F5B703
MSTVRHRRTLGPGPDVPEPLARDPRTLTAAERAANGEWTAVPTPELLDAPRPARRRLGGGPTDPGTLPMP